MAQTAARLVDHVIPHVPVRPWVLIWVMRLPIPLRLLLAAQPKLVTPVLQVVHRVITRHLLGQSGLKADEADEADSGAVTLIQPNFHDRLGRQPGHPPALPGAGRRVPVRCRRRPGLQSALQILFPSRSRKGQLDATTGLEEIFAGPGSGRSRCCTTANRAMRANHRPDSPQRDLKKTQKNWPDA